MAQIFQVNRFLSHNYTHLKKHLEDDRIVELYPYHTDKCVEIRFD